MGVVKMGKMVVYLLSSKFARIPLDFFDVCHLEYWMFVGNQVISKGMMGFGLEKDSGGIYICIKM
jgi:hypothetical protein